MVDPPTMVMSKFGKPEPELEVQEGGYIVFFKNGKSQGIAFQNIFRGTYYPSVSLYFDATVQCNFGPDFLCPPQLEVFTTKHELIFKGSSSTTTYKCSSSCNSSRIGASKSTSWPCSNHDFYIMTLIMEQRRNWSVSHSWNKRLSSFNSCSRINLEEEWETRWPLIGGAWTTFPSRKKNWETMASPCLSMRRGRPIKYPRPPDCPHMDRPEHANGVCYQCSSNINNQRKREKKLEDGSMPVSTPAHRSIVQKMKKKPPHTMCLTKLRSPQRGVKKEMTKTTMSILTLLNSTSGEESLFLF